MRKSALPGRLFRRAGVVAAALATVAIGITAPASAATASPDASATAPVASVPAASAGETVLRQDFWGYGVNIRTAPNLNATIVGQGNAGDGLYVMDATNGPAVHCEKDGSTSSTWYYISNSTTKVKGWISACYYTGKA